MSVKKDIIDWNANTTFVESFETVAPTVGLKDIEMNTVKESSKKPKAKMEHLSKLPRRSKLCTTIPVNHSGPVPGIPVGTCWEKRIQVSEAGVHRPPVGGIHGRGPEGAYSIVLSGAYDEDADNGEEFFYSGSGGGVTDPHKLITPQANDQTLTLHNKALAMSCNAPFNDQIGADAEDWRGGKPIRVIRNHKLKRISKYAPDEGNRYDGIYKVVSYQPKIAQNGLLVWKFFLRRDDPEPAPWTEEGKRVIKEKNLQIIRANKTDYVKRKAKRLSKKPSKYNNYYFPGKETFEKFIKEVSIIPDERVEPQIHPFPTKSLLKSPKKPKHKSKSKKSLVQQLPQKNMSKISYTRTSSENQKTEPESEQGASQSYKYSGFQFPDLESCRKKMMELEMERSKKNAERVDMKSTPNQLDTNRSQESLVRQNQSPKLITSSKRQTSENSCFQFTNIEKSHKMILNPDNKIDHHTFPTAEMVRIEESEIKPGIRFSQDNLSPEPLRKRICNPESKKSQTGILQPIESASKLNIKVSSVISVNHKASAANHETSINKKTNAVRKTIINTTEPLKTKNQIDLTPAKKQEPYVLPANIEKFIDSDILNHTIWEYCRKTFLKSEMAFLNIVKLMFTCRCCCKLVADPVTTPCDHNVCMECISNRFSQNIYFCPDCRNNLGQSFKMKENKNLANALEKLFPGYKLRR